MQKRYKVWINYIHSRDIVFIGYYNIRSHSFYS